MKNNSLNQLLKEKVARYKQLLSNGNKSTHKKYFKLDTTPHTSSEYNVMRAMPMPLPAGISDSPTKRLNGVGRSPHLGLSKNNLFGKKGSQNLAASYNGNPNSKLQKDINPETNKDKDSFIKNTISEFANLISGKGKTHKRIKSFNFNKLDPEESQISQKNVQFEKVHSFKTELLAHSLTENGSNLIVDFKKEFI